MSKIKGVRLGNRIIDSPGETEASMIAIFKSGRAFPSTYAVLNPQEPAPTITMSLSAYVSRSLK